ncbi:MAG: MFS transporter [Dehalococcoidia bacterium]
MPAEVATNIPPAARFLPKRLFYGWYVAMACGVLMFVGVGVGYYGLPIFLKPLRVDHGWSTTEVSWAPAIYFCVAGLTAALTGPIIDRAGPIRFMAIGTVINAISGALIGFVDELWQLYLVYFVFAVAYGLSSGVAVQAIMTRWFIRKRALAMSISSTGVSLGGVVIAPVAGLLIHQGGLELATPILGGLVLVAGLPVILLVLAWTPQAMGLEPDGQAPSTADAASRRLMSTQQRAWTRQQALRTVSFWAILAAFLLVLIAQTGYIIHQVSFLEEKLDSRTAAVSTISLTAFGSIVARLVVGIFADGIDRRWLSAILFAIQGSCVLAIIHIDNHLAIWALTLLFGFTIGNVYMMQSLLVGEIFGMVSFGTVFGLISFAGQTGSGIGPIGIGWLHDVNGNYELPFTVTAAMTFAAAVIVLFARPAGEPSPAASTARVDGPREAEGAAGGP